MARITVEDCLQNLPNHNRFQLALLASRRARQLSQGARPLVQSEDDNFAVLSLREIATGKVTEEFLDSVDEQLEGAHVPESVTVEARHTDRREGLEAEFSLEDVGQEGPSMLGDSAGEETEPTGGELE